MVHAGVGRTYLQAPLLVGEDFVPALAWVWNDAGLRVELVPGEDMDVMNWKKLDANCAINPLTALRGCTNGGLKTRKYSAIYTGGGGGGAVLSFSLADLNLNYDDPEIMYHIFQEVSTVAIAEL